MSVVAIPTPSRFAFYPEAPINALFLSLPNHKIRAITKIYLSVDPSGQAIVAMTDSGDVPVHLEICAQAEAAPGASADEFHELIRAVVRHLQAVYKDCPLVCIIAVNFRIESDKCADVLSKFDNINFIVTNLPGGGRLHGIQLTSKLVDTMHTAMRTILNDKRLTFANSYCDRWVAEDYADWRKNIDKATKLHIQLLLFEKRSTVRGLALLEPRLVCVDSAYPEIPINDALLNAAILIPYVVVKCV